jgi:hypothetical protein
MCPYTWQDQSDLHEKGGTPVGMRSLLLSLETTERVCCQEILDKSKASRNEKPSYSEKCGKVRSETSVASCDEIPSHSDIQGT